MFPIGGKEYVIPELGYTEFLLMQKIRTGETPPEIEGMDAVESWRLAMGTAWDDMTADNVPGEAIARAGLATLAFFEVGREAAEAIWENGIDPKAMAASILAKIGQSLPNDTGAANVTPSAASTSGTNSRPTGRRKARAKASPSRKS